MKASEYIADLLVKNGIKDIFSVVGGGAMHMNDSFGNNKNLNCIYMLHEQAAAIAAEGYARVDNVLPVVCVTSGPGGTNVITGLLCAWQDSIPMLVISGQVKRNSLVESTGLNLRQYGEQEHTIIRTVKNMTKYAVTIKKPQDIRYCIERAIYLAKTGRRGPCWVDVPLDIQGMDINIEEQRKYIPKKILKNSEFNENELKKVLLSSKRPVILAGSAIRTANVRKDFLEIINELKIPVVVARSNADIVPLAERFYYGNFGTIGGRAGNFIIQNADCLLVLGCRLSMTQVGFNYEQFSPNSYKIYVDVDREELRKPSLSVDMPINMDLEDFILWLRREKIHKEGISSWISYCDKVRDKFPIIQDKFEQSIHVNPYYFAETMKKYLKMNSISVVGNSCSCVSIKQCGVQYDEQRLWGNINCGTMGYDLPAAIGAAVASKRLVTCYAGDGSIQLNIQELQTIINYNLPIKLFIFNNGGYRSIVLSQSNSFSRLSGCTEETGLKLPQIKKVADAYGIPYFYCDANKTLDNILDMVMRDDNFAICEIIEDVNQAIEPKMSNKILESGEIISPSLDNLAPFLDDSTYQEYAIYKE